MPTVRDIVNLALYDAGITGVGLTASAEDANNALTRLQWMMSEWQEKRWLIYRTKFLSINSTGATTYTVGPGGDLDTGTDERPDRLENGCFARQIQQGQPYPVDYPLELLESREDYSEIALKALVSFPSYIWYDPDMPLGVIYPWPVPQASIYSVFIALKSPLTTFASLDDDVGALPQVYRNALYLNLAVKLRDAYDLPEKARLSSLAKAALNTVRGGNVAIKRLNMPVDLVRPGIYNPYSDRIY